MTDMVPGEKHVVTNVTLQNSQGTFFSTRRLIMSQWEISQKEKNIVY